MSDLLGPTTKLEPFLLMAKSAKGAAAGKLIQDATAAPGVYVFAELLDIPNVQELASNPQLSPFLSLLHLFSYGTYDQYKLQKDSLPPLNPAQLTKLKRLSIVSLAMESRILPYATLLNYLDISSIRELEDLIIDSIYQDVIRGKLDQKEQQFEVEYIMGRDLRPGQLEQLHVALQSWSQRTAEVLSALDAKITEVSNLEAATKAQQEEYEQHRLGLITDIQKAPTQGKQSGGAPSGPLRLKESQDDAMDWDPTPSLGGPDRGGKKKAPASGPSVNTRKRNRG
ncbi:hypothetical protein BOTBODRAFT_29719 [Botryobasidium botryosum FD-172 SS1]|uniref:PCI domain-containing protein n=1 Tax=Botryobasidium botryosum (strain FD-172 SS1) TaxID=930990 RepID=A0A067MPP8_BOTB1|nr:hypothetical protein BOTBODRAFT_29719 [Botryobasidium botryosum FD-172 SS1]